MLFVCWVIFLKAECFPEAVFGPGLLVQEPALALARAGSLTVTPPGLGLTRRCALRCLPELPLMQFLLR